MIAWLQPPAVLPLPSRTGADGPPRPFGVEPPAGREPSNTPPSLARAQSHALLYGPFPHGGLARGVSDGDLMLSEDTEVRAQTMSRVRALGGSVARIPVDWRNVVQASPPAGFQARDPASPAYDFSQLDAAVESAVSSRAAAATGRLPRARFRRSASPLALRLPRQLGAQPDGAGRIRGGSRQPLRRRFSRPAAPRRRAAARAPPPSVERAQPRALPGAPVGGGRSPLERILATALPPAAERVLRGRQVGPAERHGRRRRRGP